MLGNRNARQIARALVGRQHYVALGNMVRVYPRFWRTLFRYLTASGEYPSRVEVRTPIGKVSPMLYSHHDLLTVNEVFCRTDYRAGAGIRTVVDVGSNIGISALYFLTRNPTSRCYLFEPDPRNVARLRENLAGLESRYTLVEKAVSDTSGRLPFGVEPTGRYGGLGVETGTSIEVECLSIGSVLADVLAKEEFIDILKLDIEGAELRTIDAIDPAMAARIRAIYLEASPSRPLLPDLFEQRQYGSTCQLTRRSSALVT